MNPYPSSRKKPSGIRLKSTKDIINAYITLLTESRPNCTHAARMALWDDKELIGDKTHAEFSRCVNNMLMRIWNAYDLYWEEYPPPQNMNQALGMMTRKKYIALLEKARDLPKEWCNDQHLTG